MTICIGALYEGEAGSLPKGLVVASDRMITMGGLTEFEHRTPKIFKLSNSMVALMAGDALRASDILHAHITNANPDPRTAQQVADNIAAGLTAARDKQIELDIFMPRGLTRHLFYSGQFPGLLQNVAFQIDQHVSTFNLGVSLLVGGFDARGAHLFDVSSPGCNAINYQQIGHQAIGSGQLHALHSLIESKHSTSSSLAETLFAVYAAKKRAEVAPGVGTELDLAIVSSSGVRVLSAQEIQVLNQQYARITSPASSDVVAAIDSMIRGGR